MTIDILIGIGFGAGLVNIGWVIFFNLNQKSQNRLTKFYKDHQEVNNKHITQQRDHIDRLIKLLDRYKNHNTQTKQFIDKQSQFIDGLVENFELNRKRYN